MLTSSDTQDKGKKRTVKACDRCRLKKVKCSGSIPCTRCQTDDSICQFGVPSNNESKSVSAAHVNQLQMHNDILVRALRATWEKYAKPALGTENEPTPGTHEIVRAIGVLDERALHHLTMSSFDFDGFGDQYERRDSSSSYPGRQNEQQDEEPLIDGVSSSTSDTQHGTGSTTRGSVAVVDPDPDLSHHHTGSPDSYMHYGTSQPMTDDNFGTSGSDSSLFPYNPVSPQDLHYGSYASHVSACEPTSAGYTSSCEPTSAGYRSKRPRGRLQIPPEIHTLATRSAASIAQLSFPINPAGGQLYDGMLNSNSSLLEFDDMQMLDDYM